MSSNFAVGEQLAQLHPGVTSAVILFTATMRTEITLIMGCNHAAGNVVYNLYHDDDGSTFADGTEIAREQKSPNDPDVIFQAQHPGTGIMMKAGASLGVATDTINAMTFTVYGVTETLAERVRGL